VLVADISVTDPLRGGDFELTLDGMPGDPASRPQDYDYRLPFDYGRVRVDQGPGGRFSHGDAQNLHAVDFAVPEGTRIVAAREGLVMQVESDFDKAGLNREKYGGRANFIRILHSDGSMALYAHLRAEGVQVRVGQYVRKGQYIGLSGNTGFSTAPHLHFVVQANRGMRLESVPFRMFGPLGQLQFPSAR
jgi:murein DD-endopeptidase MepM/ murein hydrolase activator NlpD